MDWQNILKWFGNSLGLMAFFSAQLAALIMIPLGLPGLWFQVAAACLLTAFSNHLGWWWTAAIIVLAVSGEVLEWLLGELGLKSVGASKLAAWGSLLCGFVFAFFGFLIPIPIPLFGQLLGAMAMSFVGTLVGAIVGEMAHERKMNPNFHIALGAVLGRACGISAKLSLSFIATGVAFLALLIELATVFSKIK